MRTLLCSAALSLILGLSACSNTDNTGATAEAQTPSTQTTPANGKAKNVILFVGDGMGISTITAMRIYDGQTKGMDGEDNVLSFEEFSDVALVKTYNLDAQVPDSAGTAAAMNTGLKTQRGKINVQPGALLAGCANDTNTPPVKLMDHARARGVNVGIVSTARITHATPAAVYGHSADRGWETDVDLPEEAVSAGCKDLATQLVEADLSLALGGGRYMFESDERLDKVDLTESWSAKSDAHAYVSNAAEFRAIPAAEARNVLGLFTGSHVSYEADRNDAEEPSLEEMTVYAIENMSAREGGYFLMIEAGRIDHAHHGANAYRALSDGQEFAQAIGTAREMTNPEDTLILVTADHSHVFSIAGYPGLGNPILGLTGYTDETGEKRYLRDQEGNPYTTLGYQNGPNVDDETVLTDEMVTAKDYQQRSAVPLRSETHAGEDVALYADGPGSEGARGVIDQSEIYDIILSATGWDSEGD